MGFLDNFVKKTIQGYKAPAKQQQSAVSELESGLYSLVGNGEIDYSAIDQDPLYQLDLAGIEAQYSGAGGVDSELANRLTNAAAQNMYGGPSIPALQNYGNALQMLTQSAYNQAGDYVNQQAAPTAQLYGTAQNRMQDVYNKVAGDIAAATQAAAAATAASTQGTDAGVDSVARAQQAQQATMGKTAQQVAEAGKFYSGQLASTGAEQQNILKNFASGIQTEAGEKRAMSQKSIDLLIDKARAEMDLAQAKTESAQARIRASAAASGAGSGGKKQKAIYDALSEAIKRQKSEGKAGLTGIRGVLNMAKRMGKPNLANKYVSMVQSAKDQARAINAERKRREANPNGLTAEEKANPLEPTTPELELQKAIENAGGGANLFDIRDKTLDPRGPFMQKVLDDPGLSFLRKYLIRTPDEARRQNQYYVAFGRDKRSYDQAIAEARKQKGHTIAGVASKWNPEANFINEMNARFTPFLNMDAIRANKSDIQKYEDYFSGMQEEMEALQLLDQIFKGKYGTG